MAETRKNNFLLQGGILAAAGILSRIIGVLYRIPMVAIIGEEGMGVYSTAYSIYNIMLILSSYSLPSAVSKLISTHLSLNQFKNVRRIFAVSFAFGAAIGLIFAGVMVLGADFLAGTVMKMPEAALAVRTLAPTVFVMGMLGVVRGFFQGHGTMVPTAVSQILEQIVHVAVSLLAGWLMFSRGLALDAEGSDFYSTAYGASGATIGTGVGALTALLFLAFIYLLYRKRTFLKRTERDPSRKVLPTGTALKMITFTAFPIILSATLGNVINIIDQSVFGNFIGTDYKQVWGVYTSKYTVLINVPIAIAAALSASTLPAVSAEMAQGRREAALEKAAAAIRFIAMIAIPASVGLMALGRPCFDLLFRSTSNELAGRLMSWGAFAVLTTSLSTVCVGIMQGCGYFWEPVKNYVIALVIHVPVLYASLAWLGLGIRAVVLAFVLFNLSTCVLNMLSMRRTIGYRQEFVRSFLTVFAAAGVMGGAAFFIYRLLYGLKLGNTLSLLGAFVCAVAIYFVLVLLLGAVNADDLRRFPKGEALVKLARKLHLLRSEET